MQPTGNELPPQQHRQSKAQRKRNNAEKQNTVTFCRGHHNSSARRNSNKFRRGQRQPTIRHGHAVVHHPCMRGHGVRLLLLLCCCCSRCCCCCRCCGRCRRVAVVVVVLLSLSLCCCRCVAVDVLSVVVRRRCRCQLLLHRLLACWWFVCSFVRSLFAVGSSSSSLYFQYSGCHHCVVFRLPSSSSAVHEVVRCTFCTVVGGITTTHGACRWLVWSSLVVRWSFVGAI